MLDFVFKDENDNSPVFLQSEYTFYVNESETGKCTQRLIYYYY